MLSPESLFFGEAGWLANPSTLIYPCVSSWNFRESITEITSSKLDYKILACLGVVFRKLFFFFAKAS
jgi:hypothetical protein